MGSNAEEEFVGLGEFQPRLPNVEIALLHAVELAGRRIAAGDQVTSDEIVKEAAVFEALLDGDKETASDG